MTPIELMENLSKYLQETVVSYTAVQKSGETHIDVFPGYPPLKSSGKEGSSFIYVVVTEFTDKENGDLSSANVEIGFSIYDQDEKDGWRSLYNIMEHVRQALLKKRILASKHMLLLPIKGEILEDQPWPQWRGIITTTYTIGQPVMEENFDDYQEF